MTTDKDYLKELMNSISPLVYPDGIPGEEDEEVYDDEAVDTSDVVVPEDTDIEPMAEVNESENNPEPESNPEPEIASQPETIDVTQEESSNDDSSDVEESAQTDAANETSDAAQPEQEAELEEEMLSLEDIDALLSEKGAPEPVTDESADAIELDADMSAEDIEALLNAAKEVDSSDAIDTEADVKDILSMFSDDAELSDIKDTLEKDDNNQAVDESALATPEVELPNIDEEEEQEDKKTKAKKEKKEKKEKKSKKEKKDEEPQKDGEKKGFFAKLLNLLTEEVAEEEAKPVSEEEGQTGVTDENIKILNELDAEEGKKKKKEKKPKKKGKKGKGEEAKEGSDEEEIRDKDEEGGEPEGKGKKKKQKKEKKPKKEKAPKEPEKPGKKLPKKRVRNTVILCASIFAAIVLLSVLANEFMNLSKARYAFESADYGTAYENLYGLELEGDDKAIYDKSMTIMLLSRKVTSYENYKRLGMEMEAVNALIQGIKLYGEIRENAVALGVSDQVEDEHNKLIGYLAEYNLSEIQAAEIAALESKVEYNKTLQSLVTGGSSEVPDVTESSTVEEEENDGMQDVLKEEQEDLFGTPSQEIQIGYDDEGADVEDVDIIDVEDIVPVEE